MKKTISIWFLYILKCKDGSLYTGITNNLANRIKAHNTGRGSKYVHSRGGGKLAYQETFSSKSSALKREAIIKKLCRQKKHELLELKSIPL